MNSIVIVPCYNESNRLNINEFEKFAKSNPNIKFLFVNDGSSDDTLDVLLKMQSDNCSFLILDLKDNVGKAEAVRKGVLHSLDVIGDVDLVAFFDADIATPLSDLKSMIEIVKMNQYYMVTGCRFKRMGGNIERRYIRFLLGRIFATFAANILKLPVYDTQCGAKLFKAEIAKVIFEKPFISRWLFDIELFARIIISYGYLNAKSKILEYPLTEWKDIKGSKLGIKDIIRQPYNLYKIHSFYKINKIIK